MFCIAFTAFRFLSLRLMRFTAWRICFHNRGLSAVGQRFATALDPDQLPNPTEILSSEVSRWSAALSDFESTSLMPAACASFKSCPLLCIVNISIAVAGAAPLICRAASSPFITGIAKSKITISGCSSITFATAILPFSASPHTVQFGFCSMQQRSE